MSYHKVIEKAAQVARLVIVGTQHHGRHQFSKTRTAIH